MAELSEESESARNKIAVKTNLTVCQSSFANINRWIQVCLVICVYYDMKIINSLDRKFFEYQLFVDFKTRIQSRIVVYQVTDNVLCLSMRRTSEVMVKEILDKWFSTTYESNETEDVCLRMIDEIENLP